jgi:NADPH-dependent 2,4-dienoyl-CoA reductase/sulfur reductase-like enzyme
MEDKAIQKIVVIGGGPAGVYAAIEAKRFRPSADVVLLSEECCEPYERPPLSKAAITGKAAPDSARIAGSKGVEGHGVRLERGARCVEIDRAARVALAADGRRYAYDALVLATGCRVRVLPQWPLGAAGVFYLRTEAHARALAENLRPDAHLILIGGGLIGLEVAASARKIGVRTTVLEKGPRILARVCDERTGGVIAEAHASNGVDIKLNAGIERVEANGAGFTVTLAGGEVLTCDLALVGAGVEPDTDLAKQAGLAVEDGILADEFCRTSDPAIYAAGDVARFPGPHGPTRLENWRHALDHGAVAGRNAAGGAECYQPVPSFWSEQYDLFLQGLGWPGGRAGERIHRSYGDGRSLVFDLTDGAISFALGINAQRDMAATRRLIERRTPVAAPALADPGCALADLLAANAASASNG